MPKLGFLYESIPPGYPVHKFVARIEYLKNWPGYWRPSCCCSPQEDTVQDFKKSLQKEFCFRWRRFAKVKVAFLAFSPRLPRTERQYSFMVDQGCQCGKFRIFYVALRAPNVFVLLKLSLRSYLETSCASQTSFLF
jgi:hypothetical protein